MKTQQEPTLVDLAKLTGLLFQVFWLAAHFWVCHLLLLTDLRDHLLERMIEIKTKADRIDR